jgi:hypothetical protein
MQRRLLWGLGFGSWVGHLGMAFTTISINGAYSPRTILGILRVECVCAFVSCRRVRVARRGKLDSVANRCGGVFFFSCCSGPLCGTDWWLEEQESKTDASTRYVVVSDHIRTEPIESATGRIIRDRSGQRYFLVNMHPGLLATLKSSGQWSPILDQDPLSDQGMIRAASKVLGRAGAPASGGGDSCSGAGSSPDSGRLVRHPSANTIVVEDLTVAADSPHKVTRHTGWRTGATPDRAGDVWDSEGAPPSALLHRKSSLSKMSPPMSPHSKLAASSPRSQGSLTPPSEEGIPFTRIRPPPLTLPPGGGSTNPLRKASFVKSVARKAISGERVQLSQWAAVRRDLCCLHAAAALPHHPSASLCV